MGSRAPSAQKTPGIAPDLKSLGRRLMRLDETNPLTPYLYLAPYLIIFSAFFGYPLVQGFYMSFTDWSISGSSQPFVGWDNYLDLFNGEDDLFLPSLQHTFFFTAGSVPLLIILALALAIGLNARYPLRLTYRSFILAPIVVNVTVTSLLWRWMLDPQVGLLNYYFEQLGLPTQRWILEQQTAMWVIIAVTVWWTVGHNVLLFLAGLQNIPESLYEAARIDGAGSWSCFRYVTLPGLLPTTMFVTIIQVIASFKIFGQVYVITSGGPYDSTRVLVQHIYETGFVWFKMGDAAAMAWVLFVVIMFFTLIQLRYFNRRVERA